MDSPRNRVAEWCCRVIVATHLSRLVQDHRHGEGTDPD